LDGEKQGAMVQEEVSDSQTELKKKIMDEAHESLFSIHLGSNIHMKFSHT
jgi:hypothetical protein